jgi:hypothetical protein
MINFKVTARNRVAEIRRELQPRAGRAVNAWARNVLAISRQLVNVDKGDLKRSGRIVPYANTRGDGRQRGVAKSVGYFAPHAKLVHDGWSGYAGNPYLLAAFEACRRQLLEDLAKIYGPGSK